MEICICPPHLFNADEIVVCDVDAIYRQRVEHRR